MSVIFFLITLTLVYFNDSAILNSTHFSRLFLLFIILTAAVGLILNYTYLQPLKTTKQCNLDLAQQCDVFDNGQQVSVQFLQRIEVEEELHLVIKVPENTQIKQMWVQGINMYMGKNVVLADSVHVNQGAKVYNARVFLGACSEPAMKWQLIIQTSDESSNEQSWFFNFSTDRNKKAD
ncbi:hypothetical protein [uncultured Paraglaciecola sp.]|uniref:hypothetical protein n=1 Tax=uncultured Paraglaciecola sp. TaxID=1765024 RepID=UPI00261740A0|nr:hypothetical protein [uncultured Paraglaciecola sp.]